MVLGANRTDLRIIICKVSSGIEDTMNVHTELSRALAEVLRQLALSYLSILISFEY